MEKILSLPAHEAVSLLKEKKISSLELIDKAESRIREVDGLINAVPTLCIERAKAKAEKIESGPKDDLPPHYLYGLPILVKDLTEVKGVKTTYGSRIFKDHVPPFSNYLVERLEKNGAVVIGKSNTPEFGAGGNTFNDVVGATRNPWNPLMSAGGSSGGSAAALAAGETWLATGNDLAGSLRTPASFCSVVGFRPSPGRIASGPGPAIFNPLAIEGPMGRSVQDTALMMDNMVGFHPGDPLSLEKPGYSFFKIARQTITPVKVAYSTDLGGITPVDKEVAGIFMQAVKTISGNITATRDCPDFKNANKIFHTLRAAMLVHRLSPLLKEHRELFKPELIWNIEKGMDLTMEDLAEAEQLRAQMYYSVLEFFNTYDLLICPTAITLPFDVNTRYIESLGETKFDNYIDWLTIVYAISVTACPVISIPCGFSETGLPVGLQIVGPPRRDDLVIGAAAHFENLLNLSPSGPVAPKI